jgi:hypothetical protein
LKPPQGAAQSRVLWSPIPYFASLTIGMLEDWNYGMMGFGEMVQWLAAKITWTWKLEMFIDEKLPLKINIPIFHHSRCVVAGTQASEKFIY